MAFETSIKIGDREVTVFELTVRQVRDMAKAQTLNGDDPLGSWLIEDAPLGVLAAMCDQSEEDFEDWRPSEIKQLAERCKEVNPDFFDMNRRLNEALQQLNRSKSSTGQSPPLQKRAM